MFFQLLLIGKCTVLYIYRRYYSRILRYHNHNLWYKKKLKCLKSNQMESMYQYIRINFYFPSCKYHQHTLSNFVLRQMVYIYIGRYLYRRQLNFQLLLANGSCILHNHQDLENLNSNSALYTGRKYAQLLFLCIHIIHLLVLIRNRQIQQQLQQDHKYKLKEKVYFKLFWIFYIFNFTLTFTNREVVIIFFTFITFTTIKVMMAFTISFFITRYSIASVSITLACCKLFNLIFMNLDKILLKINL